MHALELLSSLGRESLEALWIPLIVWTTVAIPAFLVVRYAEVVPALVRYWTAISVLFALPAGLVAAALVAINTPAVSETVAVFTLPPLEITSSSASTTNAAWTAYHASGTAALLALVLAVFSLVRMAGAYRGIRQAVGDQDSSVPAWVLHDAGVFAGRLAIRRVPRITLSRSVPAPLTFGFLPPVIILPYGLLEERQDLRLALLHELIHVQRRDYLLQWIEHVLCSLFIVHPLVRMLRSEISILREVTCDADVLAHAGERSRYARLLYHYAALQENRWSAVVGILQEQSHLQKRLDAMRQILDLTRLSRSRRTAILVAVLLLGSAIILVACSDALIETRSDTSEASAAKSDGDSKAFAVVEEMPELIGGLESIQQNLRYPETAREAGIEGRVIVQFVVDEEGAVTNAAIVRGVGHELDDAALEAVRKARFKPGRHEGKAVPVMISLPVTFKLGPPRLPPEPGSPRPLPPEPAEMPGVPDSGDTFSKVDKMPELIGGLASVMADLRYPRAAKAAGIEGLVVVEFTVDERGTVIDPHIVKGLGAELDEAALHAVEKASFVPGELDGKPVKVKMTLPFTFKLR